MVQLTENHTFAKLQHLDLSFNYLVPQAIETLTTIKKLKTLSLANNELTMLPENLSGFENLEVLNLSDNKFKSNDSASAFWGSLASI